LPGLLVPTGDVACRGVAEEVGQPFLELLFDPFAFDADLTHGLEIAVLVIVTPGAIGEFEK
jgi:hypothetical protein